MIDHERRYMITGINHITISVSNIGVSFDFYKEVLGFKPVMKSSFSAYLLLSDLWIALQEEKVERSNNTYSHIALNVKKDDYISMVEKLKEFNVIEWKKNDTEGDSFYFLDPSGNKFELHYSDLNSRINHGKRNWKNVEWFV